jgi:glycosyltransferase involved in cell wall biosynthesis
MKKIGFFVTDINSLGVTNLILNLSHFINKYSSKQFESVIFSGQRISSKIYNTKQLNIKYSFFLKNNFFTRLINRVLSNYFNYNFPIDYLIKKYRVDILSHSSHIPTKKIPMIFWIPDFQFIYYPNNFDKKLTNKKISNYKKISENSDCVIFSSKSAYLDAKNIFKNFNVIKKKFFVLNFKPAINQINFKLHKDFKKKFTFKNFFYVPNHVWTHKNYDCLIESLRILKQRGFDPKIICSGSTFDYRNPNYFSKIIKKINFYKLDMTFIGKVSEEEKNYLLFSCKAVINPSFFEGWSTIVEEAKYLNKNIILSDITVHKEQKPKNCNFFNPKDPYKLAELIKIYDKKTDKTKFLKSKLIKDQKLYLKKYIKLIYKISK